MKCIVTKIEVLNVFGFPELKCFFFFAGSSVHLSNWPGDDIC